MATWLLKTEPSNYSWQDLEKDGETMWDEVTNNLALIYLRQVEAGDTALIYHTGDERSWVGIAEVTRGYYINPEHDNPKLAVCDVAAREKLQSPVTLAQVKAVPELADWDLVRQGRLSVVPVTDAQYAIIRNLAGLK